MDTYITDDLPVFGPLFSRVNTLHHHHPRACAHVSFWSTTWESLIVAGAILGVAFACGAPGWRMWLFATVVGSASLVHKWSHRTRRENGAVITWLQDAGLLQHPHHHAVHHTDPKDTFYCPVTNHLNPLLAQLDFWARAEWLIARVFGLRRKPDSSARGGGPAPAWLQAYEGLAFEAEAEAAEPAPARAKK